MKTHQTHREDFVNTMRTTLKTATEKKKEFQEEATEKMRVHQNDLIEITNPKTLKKFSQMLANNVIQNNSFTQEKLDSLRAENAYHGMDFLIKKGIVMHIAIGVVANYILDASFENQEWLENALETIASEMKNTENNFIKILQNSRTPEEAARIFGSNFHKKTPSNPEEQSAIATGLRQFANI